MVLLLPLHGRPAVIGTFTANLAVTLLLVWSCAVYVVLAAPWLHTAAWLSALGLPLVTEGMATGVLACHALAAAAVAGMCVARRAAAHRQPSMDGQVLQPLLTFGRLLSVRRGTSGLSYYAQHLLEGPQQHVLTYACGFALILFSSMHAAQHCTVLKRAEMC